MLMNFMGIISADEDTIDHLLIVYAAFIKYLRRMGYNGAEHQLYIDLKKAYDSVRRKVNLFFSWALVSI
jgi:hypothetical protein